MFALACVCVYVCSHVRLWRAFPRRCRLICGARATPRPHGVALVAGGGRLVCGKAGAGAAGDDHLNFHSLSERGGDTLPRADDGLQSTQTAEALSSCSLRAHAHLHRIRARALAHARVRHADAHTRTHAHIRCTRRRRPSARGSRSSPRCSTCGTRATASRRSRACSRVRLFIRLNKFKCDRFDRFACIGEPRACSRVR